MSEKNLIGKYITVYIDGGWKASGKVELDQRDRMGLSNSDGSIFIILKAKISMIEMKMEVNKEEEEQVQEDDEKYNMPRSQGVTTRRMHPDYTPTEENDIGHGNQYGSLLPESLLDGKSNEGYMNDFAISFGGGASGKLGKIEVIVDTEEEA
jgi:hypothetical protein